MKISVQFILRISIIATCTLVILATTAPELQAQTNWETNGPEGAWVMALAFDPATANTMYAGHFNGGGLAKSTDGGSTWVPKTTGISQYNSMSCITVAPSASSTVFGCAYGVYKSVDGADSWTSNVGGLSQYVKSIVVHPTDATIIAGTSAGVFRTVDSAANWAVTSMNSGNIRSVSADPAVAGRYYGAGYNIGVYVTTDAGATWSQAVSGLENLDVYAVAADPHNGSRVFCGANADGVYRSIDGTATWSRANGSLRDLEIYNLALDPSNRNVLYAGAKDGGLWRSADAGSTWVLQSLAGENILSVVVHPSTPTTLYIARRSIGVQRSTDSGLTWTTVNVGAFLANMEFLAMRPGSPLVLFAGTDDGFFRTTDGATSWTKLPSPLPANGNFYVIGFDPSDSVTLVYESRAPAALYAVTEGGVYSRDFSQVPVDLRSFSVE